MCSLRMPPTRDVFTRGNWWKSESARFTDSLSIDVVNGVIR